MKTRTTLFICIIIGLSLVSCSSTSLITDSSGGRDGSSFEKAVIASSVRAEYKWIDRTYPDSELMTQVIVYQFEKPFDVVTIKTNEGEEKDVYFDISKFYKPKQYNVDEQ